MSTAFICQQTGCPMVAHYWPDLKAWLCRYHAWHLHGARRRWRDNKRPANA